MNSPYFGAFDSPLSRIGHEYLRKSIDPNLIMALSIDIGQFIQV